jgi:PAS domain S-box-containing protein
VSSASRDKDIPPPNPVALSALRQSEARYRALVESVKDYAIFMLDAAGNVQTWSSGAEAIKGYMAEEITGRPISIFYSPADRAAGKPQRLLAIAAREGRVEDEGWRIRKDGTRFWADVVITAMRDASGQLFGYSKVTRDLSTRREAEEALRRSEESFRLMVSNVKDYAIFMLDAEGRVETWNDGAELIKGYKAKEIVGKHISTFYPPEEVARGKPQRLLQQAASEGRVEDTGWRIRRDGMRFWANVVITALYDGRNMLRGFTKVTRDLTNWRQAEEALRQGEERFRLLVQSVKDYAIFMLDSSGRVATWNAGAVRIKGYTAEEIIGRHFSCFYLPDEAASGKCERELEIAIAMGKFEEEGWRVRKDGSHFWANVVIEPLRGHEGELVGFVKVTRDLTDYRKAEAERIQLAHAEEAIRLRDEFLSIASHELKTPLSAIQLQLQSLLQGAKDMDEKSRQRAERAHRGVERLSDLVESLLDVSRITTGKFALSLTKLDFAQSVEETVERFREQAVREGCELTFHAERPVEGIWDRLRVEQIVTNLLANAIKYAAGTPIDVGVQATADEVVLTVSDKGPGVPQSEWARIFGRFERAASMRHYGGLGLGLYVAQQMAEAHGGAISVEAVLPRGACFRVTLPRVPRSGLSTHDASSVELSS